MCRWDITGKNIMKKSIMFMCMFFCLSLCVNASTASCKISGSTDGATVVASVVEVSDGYITVELDNDGSFAVNVTITVSYSAASYKRSAKVSNHSSTVVKVIIPDAKSGTSPNKFILSVQGSRCN